MSTTGMMDEDQFLASLSPTERAFYDYSESTKDGRTRPDLEHLPHIISDAPPKPPVDATFPVGFVTKDSGKRENLANGMVRDTEDGKTDYSLIHAGPMYDRWAELLTRGAVKYGRNNWTKALSATDPAEREATKQRFQRSAARHMRQWMRGDRDEDHAAAVVFNLNGYEAMIATDPKENA